MKVRIDKAGRLVLPKALRLRLGITAAALLELVPGKDGVWLRPVIQPASMEREGPLWVHRGVAASGFDWMGAIDRVRDERADDGAIPG